MDAAAGEKESTGKVFLAKTIPKRVSLTVGSRGSHDDCGNDDDGCWSDSWFGLEATKEFLFRKCKLSVWPSYNTGLQL